MNLKSLIINNKGVSLPLITGLVTLLLVASMAINELIIRNIRSVQRIEASNKAYMAAEAGIEDALYELGPHFAGYETPKIDSTNVRKSKFGTGTDWTNNWVIKSISSTQKWNEKLYKNQKLIISLFKDSSNSTVLVNGINDTAFNPNDIKTLAANNFKIKFTIPSGIIKNGKLQIDNDGDKSLNEDEINKKDDDGDGQIDEDGKEDTVILWKLTNGTKTLIPSKSCIGSSNGSNICESNFDQSGQSITLESTFEGIDESGVATTIDAFINSNANKTVKLYFEFLIVAPMEHIDTLGEKIEIPYIEYEVDSGDSNIKIPYPQFTIESDGYYRKFKQSITSTVTPKMTVPLFDFTIIQQN